MFMRWDHERVHRTRGVSFNGIAELAAAMQRGAVVEDLVVPLSSDEQSIWC